jgi:hypothetical protein
VIVHPPGCCSLLGGDLDLERDDAAEIDRLTELSMDASTLPPGYNGVLEDD